MRFAFSRSLRSLKGLGRAGAALALQPRQYFDCYRNPTGNPLPLELAAQAAADWLLVSQSQATGTSPSGYARHYSLVRSAWSGPYPETTGYILETLCWLSVDSGMERYRDSAMSAACWLLTIQHGSGAFPGPEDTRPLVFDTSQAMLGLLIAANESGEDRYMDAAVAAGRWIVQQQDADGAWRKYSYNDSPRAYYLKVAAALLRLGLASGDTSFVDAARKNVNWVLEKEESSGWFSLAWFGKGPNAMSHLLSYILESLIDVYECSGCERSLQAASRLGRGLCSVAGSGKTDLLPGATGPGFASSSSWACTVSTAQWLASAYRLSSIGVDCGDGAKTALALGRLRELQIQSNSICLSGNFPNATPQWAGYLGPTLVNWMPKYFIDVVRYKSESGQPG